MLCLILQLHRRWLTVTITSQLNYMLTLASVSTTRCLELSELGGLSSDISIIVLRLVLASNIDLDLRLVELIYTSEREVQPSHDFAGVRLWIADLTALSPSETGTVPLTCTHTVPSNVSS
jgi:hypothetical protein